MEYKENSMDKLDEKIKYALEETSGWSGSQDVLWDRIQTGLERKRPWWRGIRVWACAAAVLVAVAAIVHFMPQNNVNINEAKKPPFMPQNNANIKRGNRMPESSPAIPEIKFPADEYNPGDIMRIKVGLKDVHEKVRLDSNTLSISIDKWGSDMKSPSSGLPITSLAGKIINPGKTIEETITMKAPEEPGWYTAQLYLNIGSTCCIASADFFVRYPAGSIRTGKLAVNKTILAAGHKVTILNIAMAEKDATLNYTISGVNDGDGLGIIKLIDDRGNVLNNLREKEETLDGRVTMSIMFSPLQLKTKKLTIEIHDIPKTTSNGVTYDHGPWKLDIDLP